MADKRSYKIRQFSTDVQGEVQRLKAQVDLFWNKEIRCYQQFGLTDGMSILECGSGPGYVTEKILDEFPNCNTTAIEIDTYLIDILKKVAEKRKIKIAQQSITDLGFKDNSFDFVITRLVLEHLPDPEEAIWEVHRVLKPGGKAIFIDNDFEMHLKTYPEIPEINILYQAYCQSRISEGGNPKIGRQLPSLMSKCGFKNVELEIVCAHNILTGDEKFLKSEGVGIPAQLVKDGFLESSILDSLALKWYKVLNTKNHSIYRQLFAACGEKIEGVSRQEVDTILDRERVEETPDVRNGHKGGRIPPKYKSREDILQYIVDLAVSTANLNPDKVNGQSEVNDLGLDSLMVVEMINTIESEWGITLSLMDFFEGQSLSDVVEKTEQLINDKSKEKDPLDHDKPLSLSNENDSIIEDISEWDEGEI